jgi:hypothetical protein
MRKNIIAVILIVCAVAYLFSCAPLITSASVAGGARTEWELHQLKARVEKLEAALIHRTDDEVRHEM